MDCNSSIHLYCVKIKLGEFIYTTLHLPHSYGDNNLDPLVVLYRTVHFCWFTKYLTDQTVHSFSTTGLLYLLEDPLQPHPLSLDASCNHHSPFILHETISFLIYFT